MQTDEKPTPNEYVLAAKIRVKGEASSGEGSTVLESGLEDHLAKLDGRLLFVTQSESQRQDKTQHTTVCVWYPPIASA